ncbi:MAG: SusC/RagA family TonB-linked outer membrane protein [Flavobacteriaceae bacterium]
MKTKVNSFLFLLLIPILCFGQSSVKGTVSEEDSGLPLPGVNVLVKGTNTGTTTDFEGNYQISAKTGDVLVFSYVGFSTQEISFNGESTLNVQLAEDASALDEVVLIGYGSVKKEDLTGSVDVVSSKEFNKGAIVSTDQLLQGKAAGVRITDSGGTPDSAPNIRIRGGSSLNADSSPLIVIDGVPIGSQNPAGVSNPLSLVNPSDVESFTILKDASATAIYGSRASNGVIIITTKKGSSGAPQYSFSSTTTISEAGSGLDMMGSEDYVRFIEQYHPDLAGSLGVEVGTVSTDEASQVIQTSAGPREVFNTNWRDNILRSSITTNNIFSVRGNINNKIPIRASLGHNKAQGVVKTDDYERLTASFKVTPSFFEDNLKVDTNAKFTFVEKNATDAGGALGGALVFDPTKPVYVNNGPFGGYYTNTNGNLLDGQYNPLALLNQRTRPEEAFRFLGNVELNYTMPFLPDLQAVLNVGLDASRSDISETLGDGALVGYRLDENGNGVFNPGLNYSEQQHITNSTFDFYLKYGKSYEDKVIRSFDVQVGYSYQNFKTDGNKEIFAYASTTDEGVIGQRYQIINENNPNNRYFNSQNLQSAFGRSNINILDKYLITLSLRADASSLFVTNDVWQDGVWGVFPAAALAWKIKEESFLKDVEFIDDLKLRFGWGRTGQQNISGIVGFYPTSPLFIVGDQNSQYLPGVNLYSAAPFQTGLTWEKTSTFNAGIDFAFTQKRILTGFFDVFKRETTDLLTRVNLPPGQALTDNFIANRGVTESKGFELGLNLNPINSDKFSLSLNGNLSYAITEVTDLGGINTLPIGGGLLGTGSNLLFNKLGEEPYQAGVFKQVYDSQGNPIPNAFVDLNGDNQITEEDKYFTSLRPNWNFGFGFNLTYNNFDLSASFRGQLDGKVYDLNALRFGHTESAAPNNNTSISNVLNFYNGAANPAFQDALGNIQFSDYFLKNASFMRCENIVLGYNFSENFIPNTNMRVYAAVNNPFIITDYDGQDPENFGGIDSNFYQRPTAYTFGLNIDF